MPGDVAGDPSPLIDLIWVLIFFLFGSFPKIVIPYDFWRVDSHDGPQASVDKGLLFGGGCSKSLTFMAMSHARGQTHIGVESSLTFDLITAVSFLICMSCRDPPSLMLLVCKILLFIKFFPVLFYFVCIFGVDPHHLCFGIADPRPIFNLDYVKPCKLRLHAIVVICESMAMHVVKKQKSSSRLLRVHCIPTQCFFVLFHISHSTTSHRASTKSLQVALCGLVVWLSPNR